MMPVNRVVSGVFLLVLAVLILTGMMFRYEFTVVANQDGYVVAYRLDRWSGDLRLIENDQWYPVTEGNPEDLQQTLSLPKNSNS